MKYVNFRYTVDEDPNLMMSDIYRGKILHKHIKKQNVRTRDTILYSIDNGRHVDTTYSVEHHKYKLQRYDYYVAYIDLTTKEFYVKRIREADWEVIEKRIRYNCIAHINWQQYLKKIHDQKDRHDRKIAKQQENKKIGAEGRRIGKERREEYRKYFEEVYKLNHHPTREFNQILSKRNYNKLSYKDKQLYNYPTNPLMDEIKELYNEYKKETEEN